MKIPRPPRSPAPATPALLLLLALLSLAPALAQDDSAAATTDSAATDTAGYDWYTPDWDDQMADLADLEAAADSVAADSAAAAVATVEASPDSPGTSDAAAGSAAASLDSLLEAAQSTVDAARAVLADTTSADTAAAAPDSATSSVLAMAPAPQDNAARPLSLSECLDLAYVRNFTYRLNQASLEASREALRQAQAPFELNADAGFTLPSYSERRDIIDNEALVARIRQEDTNFDYTGQVQVSQRVAGIGEFALVGQGYRTDFSSNRRQDFREYRGELSFRYQQEIFTEPDEELQLQQARLRLANARSGLREQWFRLETQVTGAYYNLVQDSRQLQIQKQRLEQSVSALDLAKRKFEIGLIAEVEALRLEVDKLRAEAEYAQAATRIESRRDELRQVLGVDMETPVAVSTDVDYEIVPVDEATAVAVGLTRRTDMQTAEVSRHLQKLGLKLTEQRMGPSATLNARVNLTGRGPEVGEVGSSLERSLLSASIVVDLPLVDGGQRRGIVRQAEIDLERSQVSLEQVRQNVIVEIREAVRSVKEAERQIRLRDAALEVAERTYEVEQSRFELGLADSQQLLDAQTDLTQSRTDALNAIISYQRAMQSLRQSTMADPEELVADQG